MLVVLVVTTLVPVALNELYSAWLVGSKGTSTSGKKESWREWKTFQDKKKK